MKAPAILFLLTAIFSNAVLADWDPELEAKEAAERAAAQKAEDARKADAKKQMDAAQAKANKELMDSKRKNLGAAAAGKSDAEVNKLYDEKNKKATADAQKAMQEASKHKMMSMDEADSTTKSVTGKSLQEMQNMSDDELDAMEKQLEQKYGK